MIDHPGVSSLACNNDGVRHFIEFVRRCCATGVQPVGDPGADAFYREIPAEMEATEGANCCLKF